MENSNFLLLARVSQFIARDHLKSTPCIILDINYLTP